MVENSDCLPGSNRAWCHRKCKGGWTDQGSSLLPWQELHTTQCPEYHQICSYPQWWFASSWRRRSVCGPHCWWRIHAGLLLISLWLPLLHIHIHSGLHSAVCMGWKLGQDVSWNMCIPICCAFLHARECASLEGAQWGCWGGRNGECIGSWASWDFLQPIHQCVVCWTGPIKSHRDCWLMRGCVWAWGGRWLPWVDFESKQWRELQHEWVQGPKVSCPMALELQIQCLLRSQHVLIDLRKLLSLYVLALEQQHPSFAYPCLMWLNFTSIRASSEMVCYCTFSIKHRIK